MNAQELSRNPEVIKQMQGQYEALLAKSATDVEFRKKLLSDPRAAVSEFTGKPVPADFNVRFVENTADATIVLPDAVDTNAELSENALEAVSGGWIPIAAAIFGAFLAGATSPD